VGSEELEALIVDVVNGLCIKAIPLKGLDKQQKTPLLP